MPLKDLEIRALRPQGRIYKRTDERGLYIEVRPNGSKLWRFKYNYLGKDKRIAFGSYPEVGLFQDAAHTEAGYRQWATTYRSAGMSPFQLIETGGEGYDDLLTRIAQLEKMVSGYVPKVVDDLCGLPLEAVRRRNQEAIDTAEAEKTAALEKAASERERSIRLQAGQMLEGEAGAWLAQKVASTETSFADYAREGDEALQRLKRQLAKDSDARRKRIAAEGQTRDRVAMAYLPLNVADDRAVSSACHG